MGSEGAQAPASGQLSADGAPGHQGSLLSPALCPFPSCPEPAGPRQTATTPGPNPGPAQPGQLQPYASGLCRCLRPVWATRWGCPRCAAFSRGVKAGLGYASGVAVHTVNLIPSLGTHTFVYLLTKSNPEASFGFPL